jgi:hypothetical protein
MECYVLSKTDLSILSIAKVSEYEINLDEETNAKSTFVLMKTEGLKKDNFLVLNGLYRQFLFIIDDVQTEKGSNVSTVTALDISNIFDRKVIEKNTSTMTSNSIEQFIANTMSANFVNSNDPFLNIGYIDIYWYTNTQANVATNAENGLYNFHTFLINCRQYKNIYTDFKFEDGRLKIDIENKTETTELIDTTLPEVTDYNKIYEDDITAKVTVLIREDNSEYNLYLKTDRTTTTNANDPDRASGKIEVISVDTSDMAAEAALNVMKGNNYKHLVEFKIAKTSQLMDITKLHIGRPIRIKTDDDIYDSYISAITLTDENFVYFKSGSLRNTLIDKLKASQESVGNKVDISGGKITGTLDVKNLKTEGFSVESYKAMAINDNFNDIVEPGIYYTDSTPTGANIPIAKTGVLEVFKPYGSSNPGKITTQVYITYDGNEILTRGYYSGTWSNWKDISPIVTVTNSNGTAIKFPDGTMICTGTKTFTNLSLTAWGSVYSVVINSFNNFPVAFTQLPVVTFQQGARSGESFTANGWISSSAGFPISKTNPGGLEFVRPTTASNLTLTFSYTAIGRWK